MFDLGLWLDAGEAILPVLLGVASVALTIEAPKLESDRSRWWWRIGLVIFSLITSGVVLAQQYHTRQESERQQAFNYLPSVALAYQNQRLVVENHGRTDIHLWGSRLADSYRLIESQPRILAPGSFYYLITDKFREMARGKIGENAEANVPFEIYLMNAHGEPFVARFNLWIVTKDGAFDIHSQMIGLDARDWRKG